MNCKRCGISTPRKTLSQRYCPTCEREVAAILKADGRRRNRFTVKDFTGTTAL